MPAPITNNWSEESSVGNTFTEDYSLLNESSVPAFAVPGEMIPGKPYQDWT